MKEKWWRQQGSDRADLRGTLHEPQHLAAVLGPDARDQHSAAGNIARSVLEKREPFFDSKCCVLARHSSQAKPSHALREQKIENAMELLRVR